MDQTPLFGETSAPAKGALYAVGGVIAAWILFCMIVLVVKGFTTIYHQHVIFAIFLIFMVLALVVLFKWYQNGDLEPKFKWLLILLAFTVILSGVVANLYAWMGNPPGMTCNNGDGLFIYNYPSPPGSCITITDFIRCGNPGYCMCFTSWPTYAICQNCSLCIPHNNPPPPPAVLSETRALEAADTARHQLASEETLEAAKHLTKEQIQNIKSIMKSLPHTVNHDEIRRLKGEATTKKSLH